MKHRIYIYGLDHTDSDHVITDSLSSIHRTACTYFTTRTNIHKFSSLTNPTSVKIYSTEVEKVKKK